jgi:hypothetical protein
VVREEAESSLTGVKVESKLGSEELLEITLKQMLGYVRTGGDASRSKHSVEEGVSVGVKDVERASTGSLPLAFKVTGTTLSATAPASLHETLRRMLDAWGESGMAQITLETRFLSSNRDLVSDLGVSWQFVEAFSAERENIFPSIRHESATVVRAEASVDEYLPLVVSTLNEQQHTKLLNLAYGERHSNVLNAPKVTIFNGMEATIADCSQRPFVVGVFERAPGVTQPKVVVLEEGTKIKIHAVVGRDRKQVHIAASLDMRSVGDVTTASTSFRGAPVTIQVPSVNRRTIDVAGDIESGQTLLVGFIPTGKQKQYLYYMMSARTISESGVVANTAMKDTK